MVMWDWIREWIDSKDYISAMTLDIEILDDSVSPSPVMAEASTAGSSSVLASLVLSKFFEFELERP